MSDSGNEGLLGRPDAHLPDIDEIAIESVLPPQFDLERIGALRQQYIDRFFTKNPSLAMFNIQHNKQSHLRNICVDPRIISHPLYRATLPPQFLSSKSIIPTILARSMSESLCLEKSRAVLDLTRPGSLAINCMAMDKHHALLACGSERGVLSLYDVDEAHFAIQLEQQIMVPTIVIDTKRSISSISWNPASGHEDEILITFHFSCDAWLYNLSLLPDDIGYLRVLSPKLVRNGGGQVSLFWQQSPSNKQLIMVGGTNGYVRCWRLKTSNTSQPECLWNMRVTTTISDIPVVFLYQRPGTSHLVAINALGMVAVWDIDRVEAVAFSSTGNEPQLLMFFDFYPSLVPYLIANSHLEYKAHIQRVIPIEESNGSQFILLFRSGLLCTIDIDRKSIVDLTIHYQQTSSNPSNVLGGRTNEAMTIHADALASSSSSSVQGVQITDASFSASKQRQSVTDMVSWTSFPGSTMTVLIQPSGTKVNHNVNNNDSVMRFLQWQRHGQNHSQRYQHQSPNYAITGLLRPQLGTAIVESALLKDKTNTEFSYTLPGRIVRAIPGEKEIIVSHDLQHHLSNISAANSSNTRSSDIRLEWLIDDAHPAEEKDSSDVSKITRQFNQYCNIAAYQYQETSITNVRQHTIVLQEPFEGPEIDDGYPRVQLRTKLHAQHYPSSNLLSHGHDNIETITSYPTDLEHSSFLQIHQMTLSISSNQVTSMFAHPAIPIMFLGQEDGRIMALTTRRDAAYDTRAMNNDSISISTVTNPNIPTVNVYDAILERQQSASHQVSTTSVATSIQQQERYESTVILEPTRNIWRADTSLASSYGRTQTRILDARPLGITAAARISSTTVPIIRQDSSDTAVDPEMQLMQSIFQRNSSNNNSSTLNIPMNNDDNNSRGSSHSLLLNASKASAANKNMFQLTRKHSSSGSSTGASGNVDSSAASSGSMPLPKQTSFVANNKQPSTVTGAVNLSTTPLDSAAALTGQKRKLDAAVILTKPTAIASSGSSTLGASLSSNNSSKRFALSSSSVSHSATTSGSTSMAPAVNAKLQRPLAPTMTSKENLRPQYPSATGSNGHSSGGGKLSSSAILPGSTTMKFSYLNNKK